MSLLGLVAFISIQSVGARLPSEACAALIESLSQGQMAVASFPSGSPEQESWNYIPSTFEANSTKGLYIKKFRPDQMELLMGVLGTVLTPEGLNRVRIIRDMETIISPEMVQKAGLDPKLYGPGFYKLAIFGTPGPESEWGVRL